MRLHVGCGNKILPGYLNCDIAPVKDAKPDKLFSMLDRWPFEDEAVDEVLAVHVWEHFYEWDHPHIAAEALRVLKPGGCMVLELPDSLKCAANLLALYSDAQATGWLGQHMAQARAKFTTPKRRAQHSIWGIWSDAGASPGDEHMMHHSGWTPNSLQAFLMAHGFSKTKHGPPEHKGRRLLRDMRVVAWK